MHLYRRALRITPTLAALVRPTGRLALAMATLGAVLAASTQLALADTPPVEVSSAQYVPSTRELVVEYTAPGTQLPRIEVDGRDVPVAESARAVAGRTGSVVFAIEASSSTAGARLEQQLQFARAFVDALPPEVAVGVVYFGDTVREAEAPTRDRATTLAALASPPVGSAAVLYDGVAAGADLVGTAPGPRTLVVLTFGWHFGAQGTTRGESIEAARASGATVHSVAVGTDFDAPYLRDLAANGSFRTQTDATAASELAQGAAASLYQLRLPLELSEGEHSVRVDVGGTVAERAFRGGLASTSTAPVPSTGAPSTGAPGSPAVTPTETTPAGSSWTGRALGALGVLAALAGAALGAWRWSAGRRLPSIRRDPSTSTDAPAAAQSLSTDTAVPSGATAATTSVSPRMSTQDRLRQLAAEAVRPVDASTASEPTAPPAERDAPVASEAIATQVMGWDTGASTSPVADLVSDIPAPVELRQVPPPADTQVTVPAPTTGDDRASTAGLQPEHPSESLPSRLLDRVRRWRAAGEPEGAATSSPRRMPVATSVEARIRQALQRRVLAVQFQPVVDASTGQLVGGEALIRVEGESDVPSARSVVREASALGRMPEITAFVIPEACRTAAAVAAAGHSAPISVNITAEQLLDRDFMRVLTGALLEHSVPAGQLALEVPEYSLIGNAAAATVLHDASRLGVLIVIDDFWASTSELLPQLPALHAVKVDVSHGSGSPRAELELRRVVASAREAGVPAIAKRVESSADRAFATALGFDLMQGNEFSRPVSGEDFTHIEQGGLTGSGGDGPDGGQFASWGDSSYRNVA